MIQEWSKLSLPLVAQNAGLNFPKVSISTIGPLPVKCSAWLVAMLLTGNSFLQLQMKMFTMDAVIRMQINFIRCAGGQIILRTAVFFCSPKSPGANPDWFYSSEWDLQTSMQPLLSGNFRNPVIFQPFSHHLFDLCWQFPNWSVFLQPWVVFPFSLCREQLIHRVTLDWSLNLTLSQMQIDLISLIF